MATRKKAKTIKVNIPCCDHHGELSVSECEAIEINPRWCAYQAHPQGGWSLTHRATGYSAGKGLKTVAAVRRLAAAMERAYPPKRWNFTDPKAAKGMPKAKALSEKHGAYL